MKMERVLDQQGRWRNKVVAFRMSPEEDKVLEAKVKLGVESTLAATISGPLGGGMGRLREVCGAVSGMSLIAGFLAPCPDPAARQAKAATYALVQEFAERFRAENGAIVCRELLGLACRKEEPVPAERTAEYYKKRPCVELVACAARIVGEYLQRQNAAPEE